MQLVLWCSLLASANARSFMAPHSMASSVDKPLMNEIVANSPATIRQKDNSSGNAEGNHDLNLSPPGHGPTLSNSSEPEERFQVLDMLLAATQQAAKVSTSGESHGKISHISSFGSRTCCISTVETQDLWREKFSAGIELMLQNDLHGLQRGLMYVAHSIVELADGSSCGLRNHRGMERLRSRAERLHVLASSRNLKVLEVAGKHEPLNVLRVGGKDVHLELNAMVTAWQLGKEPQEVGKDMAKFLKHFHEEVVHDHEPYDEL